TCIIFYVHISFMVSANELNALRVELSVKAKNGIDFILSASIIWAGIGVIWMQNYTDYSKSVLTFIAGAFLLPLAALISRIIQTDWKVKNNPLEPLGLWLNFAQLFYFPILVLVLLKWPEFFLMTYMVITGAHFFPYAWYYKTNFYAIMAGIISVGAFFLWIYISTDKNYLLAFSMSACLIILSLLLYTDYRKKLQHYQVVV